MKNFLLISFCLLYWKVVVEGFTSFQYLNKNSQNSIYCDNDEQCQSIIEGSKCIQRLCGCQEKLLSSDGSKCLKKIEGFGHACEDNVQCSQNLTTGGVCINSKCKCKTGFHYLKGRCWRSVALNKKCLKDEQCFSDHEYVGLECVDETCKCRPQYYERLNSGCRRKMKIFESCNLDSDCPVGNVCKNMICCFASSNWNNVNSVNLKKTSLWSNNTLELGNYCYGDEDCRAIDHSVCLEHHVCACESVLYVASEDNKQCLKTARGKVKDIRKSSCKENAQCAVFGGNSYCEGGKCACENGTYWEAKNQFCWSIRQIGEKCSVAEDCHPVETLAQCKEQVCSCQKGYHQKGNVCILNPTSDTSSFPEVGDYCDEDSECSSFRGFCNESNACACKENYYEENGKCLGGIKSDCETNADCCHLKNTQCIRSNYFFSRQCLCLDNYVSSDEGKYCLPVVKAGGKCEESFQCRTDLGEFGECGNGVCQCKNKTHYFYGKCYRSKFVKESCVRLQDCHPGNDTESVICLKGSCSCNYGYELGGFGLCVKKNSGTFVTSWKTVPLILSTVTLLLCFHF